ncbi:transcriptional regulator [Salmonella enterica]|nr:transcriptional regulator [Salmonella enterica]
MTEHRQLKRQGTVIIFGDCWPVVSAVQGVIQEKCPSRRCVQAHDLTGLAGRLSSGYVAGLIFCLRPREHLFLFYALRTYLNDIPGLVICDEVLFTDRVMLKCVGNIPVMAHRQLQDMITDNGSRAGKNPLVSFMSIPPAGRREKLPGIFDHQEGLLNYLQGLVHNERERLGVTPFQQQLLQEMSDGCQSLVSLSDRLCCGEKRVSYERRCIPVRLGMSPGLYNLLYAALFSESVQRTSFMTPATFNYLVFCGQNERITTERDHPITLPKTG